MKNLRKYLRDTNHKLVTRRDFLAHGVIAFSAAMVLPQVGGFIGGRKAWAAGPEADCGGDTVSPMTPFFVFDMAGGASLPANFLVGKRGGPTDLLASYDLLGWSPRESGALNTEMGLPMSARYSGLLAGILANSSAEARANFRMGSICHFAQDDSSSNKMNAANLALRSGFRGSFITNGMGIRDSNSGGNSSSIVDSTALKPTFVASVDNVLGATSFGGSALSALGVDKLRALAESGVELSRMQAADYAQREDGQILQELSQCSYEKNLTFVNGVQGLDPRQDPIAQAVYQINGNTQTGDMNAIAAAVVMNSVRGVSGPGVWTVGGCDYHDGTQTTGDSKDREMGNEIGRAIELAYRLQRPFFFQLLTDGGCAAKTGSRQWASDSGDKCMTVVGYYNPTAAPRMIRQQVGQFTDGQGADRDTLVGADPMLAGYAAFANYLNINGRLGEFHDYAPGIFTDARQLESVLIFEGRT